MGAGRAEFVLGCAELWRMRAQEMVWRARRERGLTVDEVARRMGRRPSWLWNRLAAPAERWAKMAAPLLFLAELSAILGYRLWIDVSPARSAASATARPRSCAETEPADAGEDRQQ